MSFQPVVPLGGFVGWRFLNRTLEVQQAAHAAAPAQQRDTAYFAEKIGGIDSAEALVSDRRLLAVALGAFGLDDDINNRFFIQKILSDGTSDPSALSNRLADKRYREFATAFGFGEGLPPRTGLTNFATEIIAAYEQRQFEIDVGLQDENMRLALGFKREMAALAGRESTPDALWFTVMGQPPLRQVFEKALGLPSAFGALDLDLQLETLREKTSSRLGDGEIAQFADPAKTEEMVRLFLLRADIDRNSQVVSGASAALTLLTQASARF